jgi:hypothetical protein
MDYSKIDFERLRKRFEKKYIPEPNSGCYLWTASENNGYGQISLGIVDGKHVNMRANRVALLLEHGPNIFDGGKHACHRCDNKWCVNPDHLYAGTHQDNMQDAMERARFHFGERAECAVATNEQAIEIVASEGSNEDVARRFGLSTNIVKRIRNGSSYGRVTGIGRRNRIKKLTDDEVLEIRGSDETLSVLSERYGVDPSMVSLVKRGLRRAEVQERRNQSTKPATRTTVMTGAAAVAR